MGQRIFATLALGIVTFIAIPMMIYGSAMSAFGPGSYHKSDTAITAILTLAVFLVPIICIWIPSKTSLFIGGFALLPGLLIGFIMLVIPPMGLGLLIPIFIWYACAYSLWKQLTKIGRSPISASSENQPMRDKFDY